MKRTSNVTPAARWSPWLLVALATPGLPAQGGSQEPSIQQVVEKIREREGGARRVQLELRTEGNMPGGLGFATKGTLRVLRAEQGDVVAVHSVVEYSFADELAGRMEAVRTADGIQTLENSPTFGEVFLRFDAKVVADLEWAGGVLKRADLVPGLGDSRSSSPLGSEMVADLARRYALEPLSRREHNGQIGTWYGGDRRTGIGLEDEPDLPLADRVELFVRSPDFALLEVVHLRGGEVLQRISVEKLVIGEPMAADSFKIDSRGRTPVDATQHPPTWEQIQQILDQAKVRAGGELPPSQRQKDAGKVDAPKPGTGGRENGR